MKCKTCKRPPSERIGAVYIFDVDHPDSGDFFTPPCDNPIHDLADRCVDLEDERDAALAGGSDEWLTERTGMYRRIEQLEEENKVIAARVTKLLVEARDDTLKKVEHNRDALKTKLKKVQRMTQQLILETPTGATRNSLTEINIELYHD